MHDGGTAPACLWPAEPLRVLRLLWLPAAESGPQMGRAVEKQVRWFWRFVMMPLLFGLVGTSVNLKTLDKSIIPRACAIIVSGETLPDHLSRLPAGRSWGSAVI